MSTDGNGRSIYFEKLNIGGKGVFVPFVTSFEL